MITRLLTFLPFLVVACAVHSQTSARLGRDYAVLFYVTNFQPGWAPLPEAKAETEAIRAELETEYGFQCEIVANPTKEQIRQKIRDYSFRLNGQDQALFFFSLHGFYDAGRDQAYLVPSDGQSGDAGRDSWLSYAELTSALWSCRAKHTLLIADAGYTGAFGSRYETKNAPAPELARKQDCVTQLEESLNFEGRQYCASGNKQARTPGPSRFAAQILHALQQGGPGGLLSFQEMATLLSRENAPVPECGTFSGHTPQANFMLVKKDACAGWKPWPPGVDPREERSWELASRWNDGTIYLQDYPYGKYAPQARALNPKAVADSSGIAVEWADLFYLVAIPGGTFTMGCNPAQQVCDFGETPAHAITVSDFYLGRYEVTQRLWKLVMGSNPSYNQNCDDCPVERVSWNDVQQFLGRLNARYPGKNYRLPTEAEWEYAAGNGARHTTYSWGNGSPLGGKGVGNVKDESYGRRYQDGGERFAGYNDSFVDVAPVGRFEPNELGLYDMTGNVAEWCSDWFDDAYYRNSPAQDPRGPDAGGSRVQRGGTWGTNPKNCRVARRTYMLPDRRNEFTGFRLARSK